MQQCTQLTRTNSRTLDRVDPPPVTHGDRGSTRDQLLLLPFLFTFSGRSAGAKRNQIDIPGDHTRVDTPVPIPNTAVKHTGPMIVRIARK